MLEDNANHFDKKFLYMQINKVANTSKVEESYNEHPEYLYFMECSNDTDTPLPILSRINQNTLTLANYTLSSGHCKALKRAAKFLQTNINRVRFDNCGIDDGEIPVDHDEGAINMDQVTAEIYADQLDPLPPQDLRDLFGPLVVDSDGTAEHRRFLVDPRETAPFHQP